MVRGCERLEEGMKDPDLARGAGVHQEAPGSQCRGSVAREGLGVLTLRQKVAQWELTANLILFSVQRSLFLCRVKGSYFTGYKKNGNI